MEMTQYQKDLVRMWDSLRKNDKGVIRCTSVCCDECPFDGTVCNIETMTVFNAEKSIEIVTQWAEEHPAMTLADKYKEIFGIEPKNECGTFICPRFVGFANVECVSGMDYKDCKKCKEEFWQSEYKEPKKEGE